MENIKTKTIETSITKSNLHLENRSKLILDGIKEVVRTNDTEILLKLNDTKLHISGSNISISSLSIEQGTIEATGLFTSFIYGSKPNIFRRIFK